VGDRREHCTEADRRSETGEPPDRDPARALPPSRRSREVGGRYGGRLYSWSEARWSRYDPCRLELGALEQAPAEGRELRVDEGELGADHRRRVGRQSAVFGIMIRP